MMGLKNIKIGDVVEAGPLLAGISSEQIVLQAVRVHNGDIEFEATYHGVMIGKPTAKIVGDKVEWKWGAK